jgi:hypothetical protein
VSGKLKAYSSAAFLGENGFRKQKRAGCCRDVTIFRKENPLS